MQESVKNSLEILSGQPKGLIIITVHILQKRKAFSKCFVKSEPIGLQFTIYNLQFEKLTSN
jgi:hypothetical protein